MNDEYIKREDAYSACCYETQECYMARKEIKALPSADVAPVRHGRWMPLVDCSNAGIYCSLCHKKVFGGEYSNTMKLYSAYCPNCGAKMDGGDTDEIDRR